MQSKLRRTKDSIKKFHANVRMNHMCSVMMNEIFSNMRKRDEWMNE